MKVLICGGRSYSDQHTFDTVMQELTGVTLVIQGGARGADQMARRWAGIHNIECHSYEAHWDRYGQSAGPRRNQEMLDQGKPDLVISFPGGAGTADMVRRARNAGLEVIEIQ